MAGYFSGTMEVGNVVRIPGHTHWHGGTTSVSAS